MESILLELSKDVYDGEYDLISARVENALENGISPKDILDFGLLPGMEKIGIDFKADEIFIPEVLTAARAMTMGMNVIKPLFERGDIISPGKFLIGTVKGDIHDIGKNLVKMFLESGGFEVIDLGNDVPPRLFLEEIRRHSPQFIALSAMLTTTMTGMEKLIELLESEGIKTNIKVIIGGAPVTEEFANKIGADGYAPDAPTALELAKALVEK